MDRHSNPAVMQLAAGRLQCRGGKTRSVAGGELLVHGGRMGNEFLSQGTEEDRVPGLLRWAVPFRRGGCNFLWRPQGKDGSPMVRTNTGELCVCLQGSAVDHA